MERALIRALCLAYSICPVAAQSFDSILPVLVAIAAICIAAFALCRPAPADEPATPKQARPKPVGPFSVEEVATHNTMEDAWIIVDNKVYDITDYIENHPGGEAIAKNLGRDNSEGVRGDQHPPSVWDVLAVYLIGELRPK